MSDKPYDPMLKAAVKDIEKVMRQHDIGGAVVLCNGQGHSEYRLFFDTPTWSMLRFLPKGGIHIKAYAKSRKEETNATINMVVHGLDMCGMVFMLMDKIKKTIGKHFEIEEQSKFGGMYHGDEV